MRWSCLCFPVLRLRACATKPKLYCLDGNFHGTALDTVLVGQAPPPFGPAGIPLAETLKDRQCFPDVLKLPAGNCTYLLPGFMSAR